MKQTIKHDNNLVTIITGNGKKQDFVKRYHTNLQRVEKCIVVRMLSVASHKVDTFHLILSAFNPVEEKDKVDASRYSHIYYATFEEGYLLSDVTETSYKVYHFKVMLQHPSGRLSSQFSSKPRFVEKDGE